ncbi:MAG: hypothetical protein F4X74_03120 [Acidimicrobiia bacterium]|nr:hypothetical protein [Acidimicrobiia bacterium]
MVRMAAGVAMVGAMTLAATSGAAAQADDPESPAAPVNVRVVAEADGSVTVGWDVPGGRPKADGYRVHYRLAAIEGGAQPVQARWWSYRSAGDVGPDNRQGRVPGLTNGVWYELTVVAKYGDDDRVWSDDSVLVRPGPVAPEVRPPDSPAAGVTAAGSGSVTVEWDSPADDGGSAVTGYEVWYIRGQDRRQDSSEKADEVVWTRSGGPLGADVRSHVVEELVDYQEYYVAVAAVNEAGRGLFASEWAIANRDDHDPAGLIADHRFARAYSVGADIWEVWVCDVADGSLGIDVVSTVALLNGETTPYFAWLSEGKYRPEFVAGGTVGADPGISSDHARDYGCEGRVAEVSEGGAEGAVVILDKEGLVSSGGAGSWAGSLVEHLWQVTAAGFPENGRDLALTAEAVLPVSEHCSNCDYPDHISLDVVAHEMGHALGWPHSYGGNRPETDEALLEEGQEVDEYENPMDMISGSLPEWQLGQHGLVAGTIAPNRYAAGWIEPGDVAVHDGGIAAYQLAPVGTSGTQMLVIPTGASGHFISLGARVARGYDQGIPAEGVEVYRIDQRASVCRESPQNPDRLSCTGTNRRTQQVPPPPNDDREVEELTDHVYGPGEALTVEGYRVEVTERVGDLFHVWVGNPYRGAFADDENSTHEEAIETLVRLGITDGCNPDLKLFCPNHEITRAQLAKFLILALGETPTTRFGPSVFSDVDGDAWYRPYVDRLAELGITSGYGDGTYRPKDVVTRAQMAVLLTRAFNGIEAVETPAGVFDDVPASASYAGAVEGILAAGITHGCKTTPGRNYCPNQPVKRNQMASFITRALEAAR